MDLHILKPRKALNKAYLKVKANRADIEIFKTNLISLLDNINESESEEFHKNLVSKFLTDTYYGADHFINTKGRNDLVIHNTKTASGTVGVIIEAKKPGKKDGMVTTGNINAKAFQELVLYYLRERIIHKNIEIKHLVVTNIYEWFIFDASLFEKEFAQNKNLVKQFTDFEEGRIPGKTTDFFYKHIAEPAINGLKHEISFTHFDIRDYDKPLRNNDKKDDNALIALHKLLSPEHLLKLPFANDSNSLDKTFYAELLHIIGLTETKDGSKKLIQRKKEGERHAASLIESAIFQLDNLDKISRLPKPSQFGDSSAERLFNVSLELAITWINRILFLKLLEAQLIKYHKGDKSYAFLNADKIQNFDDLNNLFFSVLARRPSDRSAEVKAHFANVPYLNSSLFEPTEIEHSCLFISQIKDAQLPLIPSTVIKDSSGQKRTGQLLTIQYIFEFLNAYDFASEGSEAIQEDNKRLINASVLGLIFEKINGYKDGSFFTPGFITMYMCRETIRRAVVQKFNETKKWNCADINELYDKIDDRAEANTIVNSLKICDPAVGSGHFLVSALNEIIAIKSDLRILTDRNGKRLKEYVVEVENDELIVTDEDGGLFEYNPTSRESQRIQETLFHEKQTIIENCLFGVDLNPNSVKICRLRLWIELLKNAYYIQDEKSGKSINPANPDSDNMQLETLPNIDINIKCGNSLISRYALDADITKALRRSKWSIDSYRLAVMTYRNAQSKDEKHAMERLIGEIKSDFESEIASNDKRLLKLNKTRGELLSLTKQTTMFERTKAQKATWDKQVKNLTETIAALETEIEDVRSNRIYENAFEWRFEFPEVLNEAGEFIGFDVVIGNPPYGVKFNEAEKKFYKESFNNIHIRTPESFNYFWALTSIISTQTGLCNFIIPSSFLSQAEFEKTRKFILEKHELYLIINLGDEVFDDVATPTCIVGYLKSKKDYIKAIYSDITGIERNALSSFSEITTTLTDISTFLTNDSFSFVYKPYKSIIDKCYKYKTLKDVAEEVATGVSPGLGDAFVIDAEKAEKLSLEQSLIKKLIIGGEINRFNLNPIQNKKIIYCTLNTKLSDFPNIESHLINYKSKLEERVETISGAIPWFVMLRPRRQKLFENPKILIRQTANRIIAAYDADKWYCLKSGLIVQLPDNSDLHYYYLLSLLNSKLFDFLYHDLVNEDNRIFPEVKPIKLFKLPIYEASKDEQKKIIAIVQEIIDSKRNDIDTSVFESEIDQLVYQLYELTADEIKIIEGK